MVCTLFGLQPIVPDRMSEASSELYWCSHRYGLQRKCAGPPTGQNKHDQGSLYRELAQERFYSPSDVDPRTPNSVSENGETMRANRAIITSIDLSLDDYEEIFHEQFDQAIFAHIRRNSRSSNSGGSECGIRCTAHSRGRAACDREVLRFGCVDQRGRRDAAPAHQGRSETGVRGSF
jgi:hypothetical protein